MPISKGNSSPLLISGVILILICSVVANAAPAPGVVVNIADAGPGSLRQAILDANSHACPSPCTISFHIPPPIPRAGYWTIRPTTRLPEVTASNTVIDGMTQTRFTGDTNPAGPEIFVLGSAPLNGIAIFKANQVTIRGLAIGGFGNNITIRYSSGSTIAGNYLGIFPDALRAAGDYVGIHISGPCQGTRVGGATAAEANVISGQRGQGIVVTGDFAGVPSGTVIIGNYVGTDPTGTKAIPNYTGIAVVRGAAATTIGDVEPGRANVISGNNFGISNENSDGTTIVGNFIGTDKSVRLPLGNHVRGIQIEASSHCRIERNVVANNVMRGVTIEDSSGPAIGNVIRANSFSANTLGIDLKADGPTTNDPNDADTGPNNLQNYPKLQSAFVGSSVLTVQLTEESSSSTGSYFVELYRADTSGNEGELFLGGQCVKGHSGPSSISLPTGLVTAGANVIATATSYSDSNCSSVLDGTSEFSGSIATTVSPACVVLNTNDSGPGSLRQAIVDVDAGRCASPTISFNIPAQLRNGSVYVIQPLSALPPITKSGVVVDGATQTAFTGDTNPDGPEIVINGSAGPPGNDGLSVTGLAVGLKNLIINGFTNGSGIYLQGAGSASVTGNYLGTDPTGTVAVPNRTGVLIFETQGATVGGVSAAEGNVISGNVTEGIAVRGIARAARTNKIIGNRIGSDRTRTRALPNGAGIVCGSLCYDNAFGDGSAGGENFIAFNSTVGIAVVGSSSRNRIWRNSIRSNGALGIDLSAHVNDPLDQDTGPNDKQNYPDIISAVMPAAGNSTNISGELHSAPNSKFTIDLYDNSIPDPSGFGEGETYLGSADANTDANGNSQFNFTAALRVRYVTGTATQIINNVGTSTSEFGGWVQSEIENGGPVECDACNLRACVEACYNYDPEHPTLAMCEVRCKKYCREKCPDAPP